MLSVIAQGKYCSRHEIVPNQNDSFRQLHTFKIKKLNHHIRKLADNKILALYDGDWQNKNEL